MIGEDKLVNKRDGRTERISAEKIARRLEKLI